MGFNSDFKGLIFKLIVHVIPPRTLLLPPDVYSQERLERRSGKRSSCSGSEKMERVGDR